MADDTSPDLFLQTAADEVSPINLTQALYDKYCAQGANIQVCIWTTFVRILLKLHQFELTQLPLAHAVVSVSGKSQATSNADQ